MTSKPSSYVFMPVQRTFVVEIQKCACNHAYIFREKCKIVTFGLSIFQENVFIQTTVYMLPVR